jgi:hypothetical protein
MFKPTYLYIKTHNVTGLKYFGKTTGRRLKQYKGSGTRWLNHINYHGYDVTTEIVGYFTDKEECRRTAIEFSVAHNIVESAEWANLIPEDGISGGSGVPRDKNSQFGTMWITDGVTNRKIPKTDDIPNDWHKGRAMPKGWGDNVRNKLKGRTHIEMLGEEAAKLRTEQKKQYWQKYREQRK